MIIEGNIQQHRDEADSWWVFDGTGRILGGGQYGIEKTYVTILKFNYASGEEDLKRGCSADCIFEIPDEIYSGMEKSDLEARKAMDNEAKKRWKETHKDWIEERKNKEVYYKIEAELIQEKEKAIQIVYKKPSRKPPPLWWGMN